jgi:hypothetical protein
MKAPVRWPSSSSAQGPSAPTRVRPLRSRTYASLGRGRTMSMISEAVSSIDR